METNIGAKPCMKVIKDTDIKTLLEPGELGAMLDWKVTDPKTGKITLEGTKKSESFLQQFLQLLMALFLNASAEDKVTNVRDTGNSVRAINIGYNTYFNRIFLSDAIAGVVDIGIIIGTGSTAPTITDYVIETIIPHATMNYSAMNFAHPTADATTSQFTMTRNFSNVSGGDVTVNEVGLYSQAYEDATVRYFMVIRDVIAAGITVPNGQTLTINYRLQAVV
jgi:hypothetical protein